MRQKLPANPRQRLTWPAKAGNRRFAGGRGNFGYGCRSGAAIGACLSVFHAFTGDYTLGCSPALELAGA